MLMRTHTHIHTPLPQQAEHKQDQSFSYQQQPGLSSAQLPSSCLSLPLERRSPESCYTRNILGPLHFALHLRGRMLKRRSFIHLCRFLLMLQSLAVPCSPLPFPILTHPAFLLILPKVVSATFSGSALPALSPALALAASHPGPQPPIWPRDPQSPHLLHFTFPRTFFLSLPFHLHFRNNQWLLGSNQDLSEEKRGKQPAKFTPIHSSQSSPRDDF